MEEWVGKIWHRVITRSARREYPQARVRLEDMRLALGVLLRALSRDGGLQIQAAAAIGNTASRTLLQRVAGADLKRQAAWREPEVLHLPDSIAVFPQQALNRDLYLWLTALGSLAPLAPEAADSVPTAPGAPADAIPPDPIRQLLTRYPALEPRYQRLLAAWQALPAVPPDAMAPLTLLPAPKVPAPAAATALAEPAPPQDSAPGQQAPGSDQRQQGERTEMPEGKSGLLLFRLESLFSWTEFLPVNRTTDDDPDDDAARAAEDLDVITVARDRQSSSHKIRLNLDLPAPDYDDLPQGEGIALPEWDYRRQQLRADHCRLQVMLPRGAQEMELPSRLRAGARQVRRRFEALQPQRAWLGRQQDGAELDIDSYILHRTDRCRGQVDVPAVYRDCREQARDLACLLLADFSMSTDSWVSNQARVVDIVQEALLLFGEALSATRDRFALYGFSSLNRQQVRFYQLKAFAEAYDATVRGRIMAARPGYYTRMGAAVRYASRLLGQEAAQQKLLLLLTDGKPNDLDIYEGRYGLEDTRMALLEARRQGLKPFCVTIDDKAGDYLPRLFGQGSWVLVRRVEELPRKLPQLYGLLTRQ